MKKNKWLLLSAVLLAIFGLLIIGCSDSSDPGPTMYNVTFDMQGRADDWPTGRVEDGQAFPEPAEPPTSEKYDFVHWYTSAADFEDGYDFDTPVTGNLTLIAKWTVKEGTQKFTVTFSVGEDLEGPPPQEVASGDYASKPLAEPEKEGYIFVFWYDAGELVEAEFDFENTAITKNTTIAAKWEDDAPGPWLWLTFDDKKETGGDSDITLKKEKNTDGETVYSVTGTTKSKGYAYPFAGLIAAVNPNHEDYETLLAELRSAKSFSFWISGDTGSGNRGYVVKLPQNSLKGAKELIDTNDESKGYGTMDASHYMTTGPRSNLEPDNYSANYVNNHDDLTLKPTDVPQKITLKIGVATTGGGGDFIQPAWASSAAKAIGFRQNELEQINWQTNDFIKAGSNVTFSFKVWGLELHQDE